MDTWLTIWTPLSPGVYARRHARTLPYPLEDPHCRIYKRGRHALWHGLRSVSLTAGDAVLVPAYHHGSELEVLDLAGLSVAFYEAAEDLAPIEDELEALLTPAVRALYLTHYLGFAQDAARWRRWCDDHDLLLIEDAAMAWPAERDGRPLGSTGDVGFFSLWKTYGLPHGGALITADPPPEHPIARRPGRLASVVRGHVDYLAPRLRPLARLRWATVSDRGAESPFEYALDDPDQQMSFTSMFLLRRLADVDAAAVRRANYGLLLDALSDHVPAPFAQLADGACPFAFPLIVNDKAAFLAHLDQHGIRGVDLWSKPHRTLPTGRFPEAARRRASTVGLPVHQLLRASDLDRIIAAALAYDWSGR